MGLDFEDYDICGADGDTDVGADAVDRTVDVDVLLKDGDLNGRFLSFVMNEGSDVDDIVMMICKEYPGYCLRAIRLVFEEDCE